MRTRQLFCFLTAALVLLLFSFASYGEDRPFITRWKGEAGKELRIPIDGYGYRLIIKRASDGSVLVTKNYCNGTYRYTPTEDGELLVEAEPARVRSISMNWGSAEALLRVEQFGTVQWQTMENAFYGCKNMQFAEGIDSPDLSQVTNMENMFSGCSSFNHDLGMWKLEKCEKLGLDNCGMSVENYSKSLAGWAAQANIKQGLSLSAEGLKYNASGKAARKQLAESKNWSISGDVDEKEPFITRWKGEAGKELRIPINEYDYNGYRLIIKRASDGSVLVTENYCNGTYRYTPTEDGELLVEAGPAGVRSIRMNEGSAEALLRVEQFGTVRWETMVHAFRGCKNMQFAEGIDTPDLSQVTYMGSMFYGCTSFNQPLNNWDVSQVTYMGGMFYGCTSFNQPLNSWDVSKVGGMGSMFSGCTSFNQPLNSWNVSKVTDMREMFSGCTAFNQDLGMWKLEKCEQLGLDNCGMSVENYSKSLVGWAAQTNIKQGLILSIDRLRCDISGKAALKKLKEEKHWEIRAPFITRWKCEAGKELRIPIDGRNYKLIIKRASDGSVLVTKNDCYGTYSYTPTKNGELLVEAGPEDVSSIRMQGYGQELGSAEALLRVEQFGTVQWQTMENAFRGCKNMQFAEGIDTPDLSQVANMSGMFSGCTSFNQPLNNWDVSKVEGMNSMFSGCTSFNQPLNNWDVSKVEGMNSMFSGCTAFNQPLNNWDVSQVTDMRNMFYGCTSFNQDLGMWKLERCIGLSLDNCGMSVENYSKSLEGWAAQANIKQGLNLSARGLKYNTSSKAARAKLISEKRWRFNGDMDEDAKPFITRWKGEAGKELRIPINGNGYKLIIKRASDGSVLVTENDCNGTYRYTPTEDGELLVEAGAEGVVESIAMSRGSAEALLRVEQFGTAQWKTMRDAFRGCINLQFAAGIDTPDLIQVSDMSGMFAGCTAFDQPLNNWNVSNVQRMGRTSDNSDRALGMFLDCSSFNQPLDNWDVSKVEGMGDMFAGCTSFDQDLGM